LHPITVKSTLPVNSDKVLVVSAGGASSRMKFAKLTASDDIWVKVPVVKVPLKIWL